MINTLNKNLSTVNEKKIHQIFIDTKVFKISWKIKWVVSMIQFFLYRVLFSLFFWLYKDAVEKQNGCDAKFGVILRCIRRGVAILISSLKSDDDGKCMKLTTMYVTWQDYGSTMSKTNKQTNRYAVKELWKALSCN